MLRECVNGGTRRKAHLATFSQHGSMKSSPRTRLDRSMLGLVSEFQRMRWKLGPPNQSMKPRLIAMHGQRVCPDTLRWLISFSLGANAWLAGSVSLVG